ncbi:MAG: Glycosyl transferase family protein, partial [Parcubacteria group bacterium GW2011_GWA2_43_17]
MERPKTKLAVSLVTYNAEKYLPFCLSSLVNQTFQDFAVLVIDNGSSDRTVPYLKEKYPQIKVVEHSGNVGFAKAHNQAIAWSRSDYLCLLNQDSVLEPDYFRRLIDFLEENPAVAAISGKILIWDYSDNKKTDVIDSLGLRVFKNHRVVEIGQGETDTVAEQPAWEVFGVSGAVPVYRRSALESVKLPGSLGREEYFDELFFSYKEDVDLAWRLRLAGYQSFCLPVAVAYHNRTVRGQRDLSDQAAADLRRSKDQMVKLYSYKNHLQTLFKNEFFSNLFKYFWPIFWYELKKLVYILLFEQSTLHGLGLYFKQRPKLKAKRRYIVKHIIKVKAGE